MRTVKYSNMPYMCSLYGCRQDYDKTVNQKENYVDDDPTPYPAWICWGGSEKANEVSETSGACVALGASCLQLGVWAALWAPQWGRGGGASKYIWDQGEEFEAGSADANISINKRIS